MITFIRYMSLSWKDQKNYSWCDEDSHTYEPQILNLILYPNAQHWGLGFRIKYD